MAFGEWMKKITGKLKSFGNKVKEVVKKAVPNIVKGAEWVKHNVVPVVRNISTAIPGQVGDTLREVGNTVDNAADNVTQFLKGDSRRNNLLQPDVI